MTFKLNDKLTKKLYDNGNLYFVPKSESSGVFYNPEGKEIYEGEIKNWNIINSKEKYTSYYLNGNIKCTAKYKNGNIEDNAVIYNCKGIKIFEGEYKKGKKSGNGISYDPIYGIKESQGIYGGKHEELIQGTKYYANGEKNIVGTFVRNKLDNNGTIYHPNGVVLMEGYFWDGELNGIGKSYNNIGDLLYEGEFRNGLPKEYKNYMKYDKNGSLIYKGDIKNFKKHGHGIEYIDTKYIYIGNKAEIKFFEGEYSEGERVSGIEYYPSGNKHFEGTFSKGYIYEGIEYSPDGSISYKGDFVNGFPKNANNICIYYYNGYIKFEGNFTNGKYDGYGILYHEPECNYIYPYGKGKNILYEGYFVEGEMNGKGTIYDCYGNSKSGNFICGKLE